MYDVTSSLANRGGVHVDWTLHQRRPAPGHAASVVALSAGAVVGAGAALGMGREHRPRRMAATTSAPRRLLFGSFAAGAVAALASIAMCPQSVAARPVGYDAETKIVESTSGLQGATSVRERIRQARLDLQKIDDAFIDLYDDNKGESVRRELLQVERNLGTRQTVVVDLAEAEPPVDIDESQPLVDELFNKLTLTATWTSESDDCWNTPCAMERIDEARINLLDATSYLMFLERL